MTYSELKAQTVLAYDHAAALQDTLSKISEVVLMKREQIHQIADMFSSRWGSNVKDTQRLAECMVSFEMKIN